MRHFLFETKEYRINPYFKRRRKEQDSAVALAKLIRRLTPRSRSGSGGSNNRGGGSGSGRCKNQGGAKRGVDTRQKCVVKMNYSDSMEAHRVQLEKYLVREGTDRDGSSAKLYGTDIEEYKKNMVGRNYRIFLSPQSEEIDLKDLAQKFIKKLEQQTGYTFYWQGANHYNTAHPHAHLLINGVDKNGKVINEIPRDIVKTFMREYARDICTSQIGNRTVKDLEIEKEKELEAPRFTRLDETIKESSGGGSSLNPKNIYANRERILTRLENLRKMKLCTYAHGAYHFSPQWEENLRANARYNTFLEARSYLRYTDQMNLKVFSGEHGTIMGKVTKIFRPEDDFSNNHAVLIEGLDGQAYYVPLFKKPEIYAGKEKIKLIEGELVSIKTYESQKGRLTPIIFKREEWQVRKEIKKSSFSTPLAAEIKQAKV